MAIRKIAQLGEPVLRRRANELSIEQLRSADTQRLIADMIDTMRDADGVGLAAPQIYESVRLVVLEVRANPRYPTANALDLTVLVNPKVTYLTESRPPRQSPEETMTVYEGCLSVPGLRGQVRRPRRVLVEALDSGGNPIQLTWEGFRAVVVQHEVDHLDGVVFVDRADTTTLTFLREYKRYIPTEKRIVDGAESSQQ